ncbi:MAG TPA: hypothetical protein VHB48_18755, partial [Chitinophagaceae bacterium]|nr:hypothetical protein [Chitinophagaceae bacterium]
MTKACIAIMLFFGLPAPIIAFGQTGNAPKMLRFTSAHTAFPDAKRTGGHLYDSVLYTAEDHYNDSTVMIIIPQGLVPGKRVDMVFWFHGWRNNIDTAADFYGLTRQFCASRKNAVLVLAETAKNAPDSYGGKLEQPGVFKNLVTDVMTKLHEEGITRNKARPGNIVLAGHSGAYRIIAYILQNGQVPVREVFLFDALYAEIDKY